MDARHEYDSHVETFDPRKTWKDINFEQKKESIKRLRDKHDEPKGFAIEWMLHRRHLAASQTFKNHQKAQISTNISGTINVIMTNKYVSVTASVSSSENNSSTSASKMYDPVKDAAGAARE